MAKQRPQLDTFARPQSTFVQPIEAQKTIAPLDEQAVRETYAFAEMFSGLSESMVKVAGVIKKEQNQDAFLEGQQKINESRKTYGELVQNGDIKPSENPWLALGAQEASGVLEASKARSEFQQEYERATKENPSLLDDAKYFDALAASFTARKSSEFGTSQYLSQSFFKEFNPFLVSASAKNSEDIGKRAESKILMATQLKISDSLKTIMEASQDEETFNAELDRVSKDIQLFMDDMGQNMGRPRTMNLAVAGHLIKAMAESGDPDGAEQLLKSLKAGTGKLSEVAEVRSMLESAGKDIAENRYKIAKASDENMVNSFIDAEVVAVQNSIGLEGFDPELYAPPLEEFDRILSSTRVLSPAEKLTARSKLSESLSKAITDGQKSAGAARLRSMNLLVSNELDRQMQGKPANDYAGEGNVDIAGIRRLVHNSAIAFGFEVGSPKYTSIMRDVGTNMIRLLEVNEAQYAARIGVKTLAPEDNDSPQIKAAKQDMRTRINIARMRVANQFELPQILSAFVKDTNEMFNLTVERGVNHRLIDLVNLYRVAQSDGEEAVDRLVGSGKALRSLLDAIIYRPEGTTFEDAVRDVVQRKSLNIDLTGIITDKEMVGYSTASEDSRRWELSRNSLMGNMYMNWFNWFSPNENPDATGVWNHHWARAYAENFRVSSNNAHAIEAAQEAVKKLTLVRGSWISSSFMESVGIDKLYVAAFIDRETESIPFPAAQRPANLPQEEWSAWEAEQAELRGQWKENMQGVALVQIGNDSRNQPVFALRTAEGLSVNNKFYTANDLMLAKPYIMKRMKDEGATEERRLNLFYQHTGPGAVVPYNIFEGNQ